MSEQGWTWTIELWVPHTSLDVAFEYTAPAGLDQMQGLCERAIEEWGQEGACLLGTTIHDVIVDSADLLKAHPDHLTHPHTECEQCRP